VSLLDPDASGLDAQRPELMSRPGVWSDAPQALRTTTAVCGCGGGMAVRDVLPALLSRSARLVLDADALNALADDEALRRLLSRRDAPSMLTPHPLEAARLLGATTAEVQNDRLAAAQTLAERFACTVVLKGSGSVVAAPGQQPAINASGNALLATAGTGDVLAGWIGGLWAQQAQATGYEVAVAAVYRHGHAADIAASRGQDCSLRAADLIEAMRF
jgi:hydroxyethylthiazole kinase-like uncharacterized protein yjeF